MHKARVKLVSLALLAIVFFMFTGLSSLVTGPAKNTPVKACCDACSKEKTRSTNTCSTPDCPLYLCLTANMVSSFSILAPEIISTASSLVEVRSPFSAAKAVFHPPALLSHIHFAPLDALHPHN